jgi:hypothetical protein
MLEYIPFDFAETDPYVVYCYGLAYEKLELMHPNYMLLSSDCFGISIVKTDEDNCCEEIASYSTGRLGRIGPLAMRNEQTGEVVLLFCHDNSMTA